MFLLATAAVQNHVIEFEKVGIERKVTLYCKPTDGAFPLPFYIMFGDIHISIGSKKTESSLSMKLLLKYETLYISCTLKLIHMTTWAESDF